MSDFTFTDNVTQIEDDYQHVKVLYLNERDHYISKYGISLLFLIGTAGNVFGFLSMALRRLYKNSPIFVFFLFMTGMDTIKVATEGGLMFVRNWIYRYPIRAADASNIHGWSFVLVRYFGDSAMMSSTWILVFVNGYKFYALLRPFKINPTDTKFALISCSVIIAFYHIINCHMFWTFTIIDEFVTNRTVYTRIAFTKEYQHIVETVTLPASMVLYLIIPGVFMPLLSIGIIAAVFRNYKKHLSMIRNDPQAERSSTYKTAKMSVMALLPLSFIHICCTMPTFVVLLTLDQKDVHYEIFMLVVFNHSLNVYVQSIFSQFYRRAIFGIKK